MTENFSPSSLLEQHAPALPIDTLDQLLPPLVDTPHVRTIRRPLLLAGALVAAGVTAIVAVNLHATQTSQVTPVPTPVTTAPSVQPTSGEPTATVTGSDLLLLLAGSAGARHVTEVPTALGSVYHQVEVSTQDGKLTTRETWTTKDGVTYLKMTEAGLLDFYAKLRVVKDPLSTDVATVAGLPTDPAKLNAKIQGLVGSTDDPNQYVFKYYAEALAVNGDLVPAKVREAIFTAMSRLPGIVVAPTSTPWGTPCVGVTYVWKTNPALAETVCFDRSDTSVAMSGVTENQKLTYYAQRTVSEYVKVVPPAVLALATSSSGTWVTPSPTPR